MTTRLYSYILVSITLSGCTIDGGSIAEVDKNKVIVCTDTRDGEVFSFNTNTITNIRQGIGAHTTFTVVTDDGVNMSLSSDMGEWLKCRAQK